MKNPLFGLVKNDSAASEGPRSIGFEEMAETKRDLIRTGVGRAAKVEGATIPVALSATRGAVEIDLGLVVFENAVVTWRLTGFPAVREDLQYEGFIVRITGVMMIILT